MKLIFLTKKSRNTLLLLAGTEPLNEDGSPPHRQARKSSTARDGGKDGRKKMRLKLMHVIRLYFGNH